MSSSTKIEISLDSLLLLVTEENKMMWPLACLRATTRVSLTCRPVGLANIANWETDEAELAYDNDGKAFLVYILSRIQRRIFDRAF